MTVDIPDELIWRILRKDKQYVGDATGYLYHDLAVVVRAQIDRETLRQKYGEL